MQAQTFIPMLDLTWIILVCLLVEARGEGDTSGQVVCLEKSKSVANLELIRLLPNGNFELQGKKYAHNDIALIDTLKKIHGEEKSLKVVVADGANTREILRALELVQEAGYEKTAIEPEEGK